MNQTQLRELSRSRLAITAIPDREAVRFRVKIDSAGTRLLTLERSQAFAGAHDGP